MTRGLLGGLNGEDGEEKELEGRVWTRPSRWTLLQSPSQSQPPMVGQLRCLLHKPRRPPGENKRRACGRGHAQEDLGGR